MHERNKNRPTTADEWMDHISEFAHKWEFGSPEHSAVNDFYNLQRLYRRFGEKTEIELTWKNSESDLNREQREDRDIRRIALLEHSIDLDQGRVPGYASTHTELVTSFESLLGAAASEAKEKFPADAEKQKEHIEHISQETLGYLFSTLFEKQNPNR